MGLANMIRRRRLRRNYQRATADVAKEFVAIADGRWFITRNSTETRTVQLGKDPVAAERCPFDHDGDGTCPWHDQSCTKPDPKADAYLSNPSFHWGSPADDPVEVKSDLVVGVDVARETGLPTVVVLRRRADGTMEQLPATVAYERNEGAPLVLKGRAPDMSTILRERLQSGAWDRDVPAGMAVHEETWEAGKPFEEARTIRVRNPIAGTERTIRVGSADDPSDRTTGGPVVADLSPDKVLSDLVVAIDRVGFSPLELKHVEHLVRLAENNLLPVMRRHATRVAGIDWNVGTILPNEGEFPRTPEEAFVSSESAFDDGDVVHHEGTELFTPVMPKKAPPIDEQIHLGSPLDSVKGALAGVRMDTDHRREIDAFLDTITAPSARLEYHDVEGDIVNGEFLRREPVSDGHLDEQVAAKLEPVTVPSDEPDAF